MKWLALVGAIIVTIAGFVDKPLLAFGGFMVIVGSVVFREDRIDGSE